MNRSSRGAAFLLSLLLLYCEVYQWIPLGKWNWQFRRPVQNDQFYPDIVIGLLLTFFPGSFLICTVDLGPGPRRHLMDKLR